MKMALPDHKGSQAPPVYKVCPEQQAQPVPQDRKVLPDLKDHKVM